MQYYWEIIRRDEPPVLIPPDKVDLVKKWWKAGQPIDTSNGMIPHHQILDFRMSAKPFNNQPVLEEVAQTFNEPIVTDEGAIKAKWVKRLVPGRLYQKHYAAIPSYRSLGEQNGMVWVAYKLPVHLIDHSQVEDCTQEEVNRLTG